MSRLVFISCLTSSVLACFIITHDIHRMTSPERKRVSACACACACVRVDAIALRGLVCRCLQRPRCTFYSPAACIRRYLGASSTAYGLSVTECPVACFNYLRGSMIFLERNVKRGAHAKLSLKATANIHACVRERESAI